MSSSDIEIRLALSEDLPLLGALELRAAERLRDSPHPDCVDMAHLDLGRLTELCRAGSVWVATGIAGQPIGFVIAEALDDEGYVHELDVYQRLGFVLVQLTDYTPRMLAQRHSDLAAGMKAASRVMLRAPVDAVLAAARA